MVQAGCPAWAFSSSSGALESLSVRLQLRKGQHVPWCCRGQVARRRLRSRRAGASQFVPHVLCGPDIPVRRPFLLRARKTKHRKPEDKKHKLRNSERQESEALKVFCDSVLNLFEFFPWIPAGQLPKTNHRFVRFSIPTNSLVFRVFRYPLIPADSRSFPRIPAAVSVSQHIFWFINSSFSEFMGFGIQFFCVPEFVIFCAC